VPVQVLFVDDDRDVREVSEAFLERLGDLTVLPEGDPERALDRVAEEPVDCVVTDYRMPGTDGVELTAAVTEAHDVPVFLLTAVDGGTVREQARAAGAVAVVEKDSGADFYSDLVDRIEAAV
jgi:CheY-like chemotaxis protein